jgi:hypothetical protein
MGLLSWRSRLLLSVQPLCKTSWSATRSGRRLASEVSGAGAGRTGSGEAVFSTSHANLCRLRRGEEGQGQALRRASGYQGAASLACDHQACQHPVLKRCSGATRAQVVDKSRYAAGDNSLEREIQVLIKVREGPRSAEPRFERGPGWDLQHAVGCRWTTRIASSCTTSTSPHAKCTSSLSL